MLGGRPRRVPPFDQYQSQARESRLRDTLRAVLPWVASGGLLSVPEGWLAYMPNCASAEGGEDGVPFSLHLRLDVLSCSTTHGRS